MNRIVLIDEALCTGCGICVELCPRKILAIDPVAEVCKVTDEGNCDRLRGCQRKCPVGAIRIA